MQAGKLDKQVVLSQLVTGSPAVDEFGQPNQSWEPVDTVWASLEPLSGREFWAQQQVQSEITVRLRIRYRDDVLPGMKATYSGKSYMIQYIIDQGEAHRELQLMCSVGVINA